MDNLQYNKPYIPNNSTRDYDKDPIVIENKYSIKREIIGSLFAFAFVAFVIYVVSDSIPEAIAKNDMLDLKFQMGWLVYIFTSFVLAMFFQRKILKGLLKNKLFIKIYNDKITYDYISSNTYDFRTSVMQKDQIKYVRWALFPYARLNNDDKISVTESTEYKNIIPICFSLIVSFFITVLYHIIYFIVNLKIEKYVLIRFKGGIMAIPKKEYPSNEKIKFDWNSIFNGVPQGGSHYGE